MSTDTQRPTGGVQTLERTFSLLEQLAELGGHATLSELSTRCELPMPTLHRLAKALVGMGYLRQQPSKEYALGPRLIRLGDVASTLTGRWAEPVLRRLVQRTGETANLAMLDRDAMVYIAQAPSQHSMRMFTQVGGRVPLHCTGVGKAVLAGMPEAEAQRLLGSTGLSAATESSITEPERLDAELTVIRGRGYAIDDGEQEVGVRCLAVRVPGPTGTFALSVSGPSGRLPEADHERLSAVLAEEATELAALLAD